MKQYAWHEGARRYLKEVMDTPAIGIVLRDEPGIIEFAFSVRHMEMAANAIKLRVKYENHVFERTAHYIADVFTLDRNRSIRLHHVLGSQRASVTLIDTQDRADDLGGSK